MVSSAPAAPGLRPQGISTTWRDSGYLIQHSAGSGKTASIGWSSHLLADLHDENDRKVGAYQERSPLGALS